MDQNIATNIYHLACSEELSAYGRCHIVTLPGRHSTLSDILIKDCSVGRLLTQIMGGLDTKDIFMIVTDLEQAETAAQALLDGVKKAYSVKG